MRKIVIPDLTFSGQDQNGEIQTFNAVEQLRLLLSVPKQGESFTIDDIRLRLPLVDKFENGSKEVLLEDAEYDLVAAAVNEARWGAVGRSAVELVDAVNDAEVVDVVSRPSGGDSPS